MIMPFVRQSFSLDRRQAHAIHAAFLDVIGPEPSAAAARLLETCATTLEVDSDEPPSASPIADVLPDPQARRAVVEALVVAACIDAEVTQQRQHAVESIAVAAGVRSPWVALLGALRRRRAGSVKRALMRRSPDARRLFARLWAEEGVRGLWYALRFMTGRHRDPPLAARFRALAQLADDTLGRRFFDHLEGRGLAFPGEAGGLPERMIHHDLMHVLADCGTDPAGECELAGFYAGFTSAHDLGDAFTFIATALATFQLGMAVSPAVVTPAVGAFDPARVLDGFLRGRQLAVDVMGAWDYWSLMPLPLDEARARLGIPASA